MREPWFQRLEHLVAQTIIRQVLNYVANRTARCQGIVVGNKTGQTLPLQGPDPETQRSIVLKLGSATRRRGCGRLLFFKFSSGPAVQRVRRPDNQAQVRPELYEILKKTSDLSGLSGLGPAFHVTQVDSFLFSVQVCSAASRLRRRKR